MSVVSNPVADRFALGLRSLSGALPAVYYGTRIAASVSIALYASFFLQLDQPQWAGLTAIIVAQPVLGAALRKGVFRLIGTVAGAAAAVLIVILFPQSRTGFFLGLALWGALCGYAATALRNFAAYGGVIAGFTTAVVALDSINAPGQVLTIAISRTSTITLGIVTTALVFSLTDFGHARRDLAGRLLHVSAQIISALIQALRFQSGPLEASQAARRALLVDVAALDAAIDQAVGESLSVRARAATLQEALAGLISAMSSWRTIEAHLKERPRLMAEAGAEAALSALQASAFPCASAAEEISVPAVLRDKLYRGGRSLLEFPAADTSARLLLDQTGKALHGLGQAMNGIALLAVPSTAKAVAARPLGRTFDPLVASLNGLRVAAAIAASTLFWVFSEWPNGPMFITFTMVVSLFYTMQSDQAFDVGLSLALGCTFAAAVAGLLKFFILPTQEVYLAFSLLLGAFLVPGGALATQPGSIGSIAFLYSVNLIPMLSPENRMVYDLGDFLNNALAILVGSIAGVAGYRLIPPLSPALRARRQVVAALQDLQR
ncbi:MAG: FUSC family protein, partial [Gammaproteobacteria bacterium]